MEPMPSEIFDFIKECVDGFGDMVMDMEMVYNTKVFPNQVSGSGFCTKVVTKAIVAEAAGENRVIIEFMVSDGEYTVPCIAHNADADYLEGSIEGEALTDFLQILTESQKKGKRVEIQGHFVNLGRKRVFLCENVEIDDGFKESQLTKEQFKKFKALCSKHNNPKNRWDAVGTTTPIALMLREDTIWAELYAQPYLKQAVLLFCLSPARKQDMIHVGIVSSHGEGKDHLVERVIQPLVPARLAGSGKMATIPGLFGAMSGDDLNTIEIGLLPKMNHERVAISEFQTWGDETFGELMNMMANGKIEMQKGALDIERATTLNLLFLGNPPNYYSEEKHDKKEMLAAFGKYTHQIISRLSLIFTQLSLNGGKAQERIRNAIISSMDGDFIGNEVENDLNYWRAFFKEYLRYVSRMTPRLRDWIGTINSTYDEMEARPQFQAAFCIRTVTDNRKYQEFANLVRAFARLQGDEKINGKHIKLAQYLFEVSLQTLTEEFPLAAMMEGVDNDLIKLFKRIQNKGSVFESLAEMRAGVKGLTNDRVDSLIRSKALTKFDNGAYFVNDSWLEEIEGGELHVD